MTEAEKTQEETTKTVEVKESVILSNEDLGKVKKQIEFYFSDSNYPKDKFLQEKAKENEEGYIPLEVLTTFNRLKSITTDLDQICKALDGSDVVVLNDDRTLVKRKHPVPSTLDTDARTLFIRGIPKDSKLDDLEKFFAKYGTVKSVRCLRNKNTKELTGTVFLELGNEDEAKKMAEIKEDIVFNDHKLIVQTKEESLKEKKESMLGKRKEPELPSYENGLVIHFKGIPEDSTVTTMQLKDFFKGLADAQYVEFIKGDVEGYVRCSSADEASKIAKSTDKVLDSITLTYDVLEGEQEKLFWMRVDNNRKKGRGKNKQQQKRRRY